MAAHILIQYFDTIRKEIGSDEEEYIDDLDRLWRKMSQEERDIVKAAGKMMGAYLAFYDGQIALSPTDAKA